jgi:hypothetical protein
MSDRFRCKTCGRKKGECCCVPAEMTATRGHVYEKVAPPASAPELTCIHLNQHHETTGGHEWSKCNDCGYFFGWIEKPASAPETSWFVCPDCGPRVAVDEDGCCKHCGSDTSAYPPPPLPPPIATAGELTREDFVIAVSLVMRSRLLAHDAALRARAEGAEKERVQQERFKWAANTRADAAEAEVARLERVIADAPKLIGSLTKFTDAYTEWRSNAARVEAPHA